MAVVGYDKWDERKYLTGGHLSEPQDIRGNLYFKAVELCKDEFINKDKCSLLWEISNGKYNKSKAGNEEVRETDMHYEFFDLIVKTALYHREIDPPTGMSTGKGDAERFLKQAVQAYLMGNYPPKFQGVNNALAGNEGEGIRLRTGPHHKDSQTQFYIANVPVGTNYVNFINGVGGGVNEIRKGLLVAGGPPDHTTIFDRDNDFNAPNQVTDAQMVVLALATRFLSAGNGNPGGLIRYADTPILEMETNPADFAKKMIDAAYGAPFTVGGVAIPNGDALVDALLGPGAAAPDARDGLLSSLLHGNGIFSKNVGALEGDYWEAVTSGAAIAGTPYNGTAGARGLATAGPAGVWTQLVNNLPRSLMGVIKDIGDEQRAPVLDAMKKVLKEWFKETSKKVLTEAIKLAKETGAPGEGRAVNTVEYDIIGNNNMPADADIYHITRAGMHTLYSRAMKLAEKGAVDAAPANAAIAIANDGKAQANQIDAGAGGAEATPAGVRAVLTHAQTDAMVTAARQVVNNSTGGINSVAMDIEFYNLIERLMNQAFTDGLAGAGNPGNGTDADTKAWFEANKGAALNGINFNDAAFDGFAGAVHPAVTRYYNHGVAVHAIDGTARDDAVRDAYVSFFNTFNPKTGLNRAARGDDFQLQQIPNAADSGMHRLTRLLRPELLKVIKGTDNNTVWKKSVEELTDNITKEAKKALGVSTQYKDLTDDNTKKVWTEVYKNWDKMDSDARECYEAIWWFMVKDDTAPTGWRKLSQNEYQSADVENNAASYRFNLKKNDVTGVTDFSTNYIKNIKFGGNGYSKIWYTDYEEKQHSIIVNNLGEDNKNLLKQVYDKIYNDKHQEVQAGGSRVQYGGVAYFTINVAGTEIRLPYNWDDAKRVLNAKSPHGGFNTKVERLVRDRLWKLKSAQVVDEEEDITEEQVITFDYNVVWSKDPATGEYFTTSSDGKTTIKYGEKDKETDAILKPNFHCYSTLLEEGEQCDKYLWECLLDSSNNDKNITQCIESIKTFKWDDKVRTDIGKMHPIIALRTLQKFGFKTKKDSSGLKIVASVAEWKKSLLKARNFSDAAVKALESGENQIIVKYLDLLSQHVNNNPGILNPGHGPGAVNTKPDDQTPALAQQLGIKPRMAIPSVGLDGVVRGVSLATVSPNQMQFNPAMLGITGFSLNGGGQNGGSNWTINRVVRRNCGSRLMNHMFRTVIGNLKTKNKTLSAPTEKKIFDNLKKLDDLEKELARSLVMYEDYYNMVRSMGDMKSDVLTEGKVKKFKDHHESVQSKYHDINAWLAKIASQLDALDTSGKEGTDASGYSKITI